MLTYYRQLDERCTALIVCHCKGKFYIKHVKHRKLTNLNTKTYTINLDITVENDITTKDAGP